MKTFLEFSSSKKYIAVYYNEETQKNLRDWCGQNEFDLTVDHDGNPQSANQFKFHTTIFYSTNELYLKNVEKTISPFVVKPQGFAMLGSEFDIPVLKVKYEGNLKALRQKYEKIGLQDEWPDYKPHISLSYARNKRDMSNLKMPDFRLIIDKFRIEDLK
jgi:2'-5' RNA ligase